MRLRRFHIENFRSTEDSGEVEIGDIAVLVGKNESGKTSILKALEKLDVGKELSFDELREFPRKRYHEFRKDLAYPVVNARFELNDKDRLILKDASPDLAETTYVTVSLDFGGKRSIRFEPKMPHPIRIEDCPDEKAQIDKALSALLAVTGNPDIDPIKDQVKKIVEDLVGSVSKELDTEYDAAIAKANSATNRLATLDTNPQRKQYLSQIIKAIESFLLRMTVADRAVTQIMPRFVYFDVYQELENRVQLPAFLQRMKQGAMTREDRTADTLFKLVGLDIERLVSLNRTDQKDLHDIERDKDIRALLVNRASIGLTGHLVDIWKQRKSRVEFSLDGDYLRLWVVDEKDQSRLEYEEQSKGFHWFFSFYVIFNVEADRGHKDAILLLDEPGLHLHPGAQEEMIKILRELSERNQIIYTTHSPFMIDMDHLETVRLTVLEEGSGTRVLDVGQTVDPDTLFPIQAAIGYSLSQSLFVGKRNLVVEGVTDFWLLSSVANLLRQANLPSLDQDIVITPAGGARKVTYLSSLMTGQKLKIGVLLDSDPQGRSTREQLIKSKLVKEKYTVLLEEVLGNGCECEMEDLLTEEFYVRAVNEAYSKELAGNPLKIPLREGMLRVTQRVEKAMEERGIQFNKTRPARHLLDFFGKALAKDLPPKLIDNFARLFNLINERVPK